MLRSHFDLGTDADPVSEGYGLSSVGLDQARGAILDAVPGFMAYWGEDLCCRFANKPYLDWLGLTAEAIVGRPMERVLGEHIYKVSEPYVRKALAGERQQFERRLIDTDGQVVYTVTSYIPHKVNDDVLGLVMQITDVTLLKTSEAVSICSDITVRREAERVLRDSEARYRMLAEATTDIITQLDLDLVHRYVSPACRASLGYEPDEMLGKTLSDLTHPQDATGSSAVVRRIAAGDMPSDRATITHRMCHKLGHWVWLESGINLVRDPDTRAPQHLICSLRDVTERQLAAHHLEQAKSLAENAAAIKADFVANMSHELRTSLTGILGVHDLLNKDPTLTPQQRRYLEMAREAGQSLLAIVNDVLDFSKIEAGQLSLEHIPFDLAQLVDGCRDFAREDAQVKSLEVGAEVAGAPFALMGDPNRLRQVILNLLTNAVKFTQSGNILINARYHLARASLRVEVIDTGVGIPADRFVALFERFSQADTSTTRRYGGSGLGLAICKSLVELMGGEIGVMSETGRGSTFWFEIPLSPAHIGATQMSAQPDASGLAQRHVLLAEDNLVNQQVIVAMIEQNGHRVTVVGDGIAAVEAAQAGGFDVILLDMQMPLMDGVAAARAIRSSEQARQRPPVPIIGLTANALAHDIARCREAGMDAHVAKPIDWSELFTTITRLATASRMVSPLPVLDKRIIADLDDYIGRERRTIMLARFVTFVEQHLVVLGSASVPELAAMTHSLLSMSGQFGFMELSRLAAEVEEEAREGSGLDRIADLRRAGERALAAARALLADN